jgi:hypothetical protein
MLVTRSLRVLPHIAISGRAVTRQPESEPPAMRWFMQCIDIGTFINFEFQLFKIRLVACILSRARGLWAL